MAYSDGEKAAALIALAQNKYDYDAAEKQTGIPSKTLRRWDKNVSKNGGVPALLERAISTMLASVPKEFVKGTDWAVTLGILMDKWLVMQGEATNRTESIIRSAKDLTPEEREAVLAEAEQILARARSGKSSGSDQSGTDDENNEDG